MSWQNVSLRRFLPGHGTVKNTVWIMMKNKMTCKRVVSTAKSVMKVLASERSIRILSICALTVKLISDIRALVTEEERRIGFKQ